MPKPLIAVRARRAEIARTIERLSAEDAELAVTEQVLARLLGAKGARTPYPPVPAVAGRALRPRSQREFVLDALARSDAAWLKSAEIIAFVQKTWGEVIPEMSLRPLLTNLKRANQIVRQGRLVALKARAHAPALGAERQSARPRRRQ